MKIPIEEITENQEARNILYLLEEIDNTNKENILSRISEMEKIHKHGKSNDPLYFIYSISWTTTVTCL